jgi:hypothetical protein
MARIIQAVPKILVMEKRPVSIFPTGRKKKVKYSTALRIPIYVELALSLRAKRVMIFPVKNCQERELKTLKRLYRSLALLRR